ncbi:hypothetical protein G6M16_017570 [Agrobacterium tumefaciens]|uniref:hypothetical protein n=1 Tax=Agrobacterium TaxID=357 RepID=UPI000F63C927|nr:MULTISPECIES: hypothetical protein [Agrobacterium]MCZ7503151.1 hypothetical protein [Rhizobium rhizogenes]RRN66881.1 hypothetical protein EIQ31_24140 [Agrobacterium deltaense]WCA60972.1 hypothetical protein G6M16_017570 [Agrobacterium tumefaciens]
MTDKSGAWEVLLGEGIGPLRLGTSKEVISKMEGFAEPELVQDESVAISDFEKLLNSMGPEMGLDPEEFKEMIAAMQSEAAAEVRWIPQTKSLPVVFFHGDILIRIVLSAECRPKLEGRNIFEMPAKEFYELVIARSQSVFRKRNEIVAPDISMRFTLPKKSDFEDGRPIELLVLEKNRTEELIADGYKQLPI